MHQNTVLDGGAEMDMYVESRGSHTRRWVPFVFLSVGYAPLIIILGGHIQNFSYFNLVNAWQSGLMIQSETNSLSMVLGTLAAVVAILGLITVEKREVDNIDGAALARLDAVRPVVYVLSLAAAASMSLAAFVKVIGPGTGFGWAAVARLLNSEVIASSVVVVALALLVDHAMATYRQVGALARKARVVLLRSRWERLSRKTGSVIPPVLGSRAMAEWCLQRDESRKPRVRAVILCDCLLSIGTVTAFFSVSIYMGWAQRSWIEALTFGFIATLSAPIVCGLVAAIAAISSFQGASQISAVGSVAALGGLTALLIAVVAPWPDETAAVSSHKWLMLSALVSVAIISYLRVRRSRAGTCKRGWHRTSWFERRKYSAMIEIARELAKSRPDSWPVERPREGPENRRSGEQETLSA